VSQSRPRRSGKKNKKGRKSHFKLTILYFVELINSSPSSCARSYH
jgi:hypothetical protein